MAAGTNYNVNVGFNMKSRSSLGGFVSGVKKASSGMLSLRAASAQGAAGVYAAGQAMAALKSVAATALVGLMSFAKFVAGKLVNSLRSAYQSFKALVQEGMSLAKVQYEVEAQVSAVFGQSNLQSLKDEASRVQKLGVIGDEKLLQYAKAMGAAGVSSQDTIALMEGVADLAANKFGLDTTEENMETLGNYFAKAVVNGNIKSLKQYMPTLDAKAFSAASQQERIQMILEALEAADIRGSNAALAQTDMGKTQNVQNQIGDVKEEIGKWGLKLQALFYEAIEPYLPFLQDLGEWVMSKAVEAFGALTKYLNQHKDRIVYWFVLKSKAITDFIDKFNITAFVSKVSAMAGRVADVLANTSLILDILKKILGAIIVMNLGKWLINGLSKAGALPVEAMKKAFAFGFFKTSGILEGVFPNAFGMGLAKIISRIGGILAKILGFFTGPVGIIALVIAISSFLNKIIKDVFGGGENFGVFLGELLIKFAGFLKDFLFDWGDPKSLPRILVSIVKGAIEFWFKTLPEILWGFAKTVVPAIFQALSDLFDWLFPDGASGATFSHQNMESNALGTPYARAGMITTINERGGEIMTTPRGTAIIPADKSEELLKNKGDITINLTVQGNVIGNKQFADQVGQTIVDRLQVALATT